VYGENRALNKVDFQPRLDTLKEVLDEAGGKILVFLPLTGITRLLYSDLKEEFGADAVEMVYGDVSPKARTEIFRRFDEDPNLKIIVAHPGVMSHGLDLSVADTIVWWAPIDDLEIFEQANARIDGPRQKKSMLVIRMAGSNVEREIYRRLEEKTAMQGAILKLAEEAR
jgi:SNF2 family DNA or RNA helicase